MQNAELTAAAKSVTGIEVVDTVPAGVRKVAGPFRPHQSELLKEALVSFADRDELLAGPDARGLFHIYRRVKA